MIKIIKEGRPILGTLECKNCDCIFSYQDEDIVKIHIVSWLDKYLIKCPCCSKTISFYLRNNEYLRKVIER